MFNPEYKLVTKKGKHTYIDHFDFEETIDHESFYTYYRMREKDSNVKFNAKGYKKYFDKDLIRHFEIAYHMVKDAGLDIENIEDKDL
jgi:hypothetical protein